jgi:transcriptional regulator with XRE-family HTH domain
MPTITAPTTRHTVGARRFSGQRLALARQRLGLTQERLAERIGRTRASIANYEIGHNPPSADVIGALAHVLGVSIDSLYAVPARPGDRPVTTPVTTPRAPR